jgi:chemotaxis protein methyltransferase CheR
VAEEAVDAARARVAARLRRYAGLDPPAWLLEARARDRAGALGLDEAAYLARAADDDTEAARLADLLRVGETRFFRHRAQVQALAERVLPECARSCRAERRPLRAWSAGCATGEEAWTLAMLCAAVEPPVEFQVIASDLSTEALDRARAGRYPAERAADVPPALAARFLDEHAGQRVVRDGLRPRVTFERHNLLDARYPAGFDVILCRNVLIYFDGERRDQVIARLTDSLREGGYLFLGYSETLRDHDARFEALRDEEGVVYRKRGVRASAPSTAPTPDERPRSKSGPIVIAPALPARIDPRPQENAPVELRAREDTAVLFRLRGDYHDAERLATELKPYISLGRAVVDLDGAAYLGDEAARVLKRATEAAPELELRSSRPQVRRWLERHGLLR